MNPQAEDIFAQALELPAAELDAFLAKACGSDTSLMQDVRQRLQASQDAGAYFDGLSERMTELIPDSRLPEKVGVYELGELLGRGGMGAVYAGSRVDGQFQQDVAIKLLPREMATAHSQERFLNERQILARLEHPNICRLLDGGFTEEGLPYFVMERVTGVPLDTYCANENLSDQQRLKLFLQIGEAVHFAHQNLVLHRDLKPANILVDDLGQVRLLDFGISKVIDSNADSQTTRLPMTPQYASPEMLTGKDVTTASDVYSLGVVLYQLLTGLHPKLVNRQSTLEDLKTLMEAQPIKASTRVNSVEGDAELRAARDRRPGGRLKGDLDNILSKALESNPARRYQSVAALCDDISRFLTHQPVSARAPSLSYLAGRFVRRHRLPAALAMLTLAALTTLAVTATRSAIESRQQAVEISAERDRAQSVTNFLLEMLRQSHPQALAGEALSVQELVDRASDQLDNGLEDQPAVRAELLKTAATLQGFVGAYERAADLLDLELRQRADLEGEVSAGVASVLERMVSLADSTGQPDRALELAKRSMAMRESIGDVLGAAHSHRRLGRVFHRQGDYDQAQYHFSAALDGYLQEHGERHPDTQQIRSHLAWLAMHQGDPELSIARHLKVLEVKIDMLGDQHTSISETQLGLGQAKSRLGDHEGALEAFGRALTINNRVLGEDHRDNGYVFNALGKTQRELGNHDAAAKWFEKSMAIWRGVAPDHPDLGYAMGNLAQVRLDQNRIPEASHLLEQALVIMAEKRPEHWRRFDMHSLYGECLSKAGDVQGAEVELTRGLSALVKLRGDDDASTEKARQRLAEHHLRHP
ncbi:MAG: tetratricopeptide repeat protein [Lysobacterales bacterium]